MINSSIRVCEKCDYRTFIMEDNGEDRDCKYCGGSLEIIAKEVKS